MEKMQKLNLRMQKLNFPGTHLRGLALILDRRPKKNLMLLVGTAVFCIKIPKVCIILIESAELA